jgi:hypothetical protein
MRSIGHFVLVSADKISIGVKGFHIMSRCSKAIRLSASRSQAAGIRLYCNRKETQ